MNKILIAITALLTAAISSAQIDPLDSPYYSDGPYTSVMVEETGISPDLLIYRPDNADNGPYPTLLFQPGANSGSNTYIDKHSYDLYLEHLASYGFVVIIINNTSGGSNTSLFTNAHNWIKTQVNSGTHWMSTYVDLNRFIVAGHSNGGMNATDIILDRPDEVDAIVYLASYPNPGFWGIGAQDVSDYLGKVLFLNGSEDDTSVPLIGATNDISEEAYNERFTSASCKTWAYFTGVGHGGFGDYDNPDQPVGSLGREPVTASIRHILVSFLLSQFGNSYTAFNNLNNPELRPSSLGEFENSCGYSGSMDYTLILNVVPEGSGTVTGAGIYTETNQVSVSASANQGFVFLHWKDQNSIIVSELPEYQFYMPSANTMLTAYFDVDSYGSVYNAEQVMVYPNPAYDEIIINHGQYRDIRITDITGKQVYFSTGERELIRVDVSEWFDGLYLITLTNGETVVTRKIMVSNR